MNSNITIKNIAEKAGVSVTTVSRAIRPETQHLVKPKTLKQIQSIIKKEGYQPNQSAINLVQKKSGIIGFTIPFFASHLLSNDYFNAIFAGVAETIMQSSYELKLIMVDQGSLNKTQMSFIKNKRIDGLIIAGWPTFTELDQMANSDLPIVIINDFKDNLKAHFVYADHYTGGYQMGMHFARLGYKRIAISTAGSEWFPDMDERANGFKKALEESGFSLDDLLTIPTGVTEEAGEKTMYSLIKKGNLPRAIFFMNDISAIGALKAINKSKIRCPEDVAIAGYDDIRLAQYVSPALTTVYQPTLEIAKLATQNLIEIIEKKPDFYIRQKLSTRLVIRESCGSLLTTE